jgi:tetratricopeptide (TPR) repeat protein
LEAPLRTSEHAAQRLILDRIASDLKAMRPKSIDALEIGFRGRLLTALLRVGRQTKELPEPEKETARKQVHAALAAIWKALNDARRAALALAAAGQEKIAEEALKESGDWQEAGKLFEQEGKHAEAARLYEQKRAFADAARAYAAAGDGRSRIRALLRAGPEQEAAVRAAAAEIGPDLAVGALLKGRREDLALELLVAAGKHRDAAQIHERAKRWADAARAWEQAGDKPKAIELFRRAGSGTDALRLAEPEAAAHREKGDLVGAAQMLAQAGAYARGAELVAEARPDMAYKLLQQGGLDADALAFAQKHARRSAALKHFGDEAHWLEKAGELPSAAEAWIRAGRLSSALKLFEQLGFWDRAASCAEEIGQLDKARDFFNRAGDHEGVHRVQEAMDKRAAEAAAAPPPAAATTTE